MRLIGITTDGGGGWLPWVNDPGELAKLTARIGAAMDGGGYAGVFVAAGCGKIPPRHCGYSRDGDKMYTWWGGPDDHRLVEPIFELASLWPIVTQIGFPTSTLEGLDALREDAARLARLHRPDAMPHTIAFDVSGSNTSAMVAACMAVVEDAGCVARHESRPLTAPVYPAARYVCMAARARAILRTGSQLGSQLDPDDIIVYTGGTGTKNSWIEPEAMVYENRGHLVVQPLSMIGGV